MAIYQSVPSNGIYYPSLVAKYTYDPWITDTSGAEITSAASIAIRNPFRYRGYYYDTETGFYYLLGSACGLLISNPVVAVGLATVGGAAVDVATQVTTQYIESGEVNISEIDIPRAIKTGVMTEIGTAIPKIGNATENAVDAFGTALVWAEGSAIITVVDVVVTKVVEAIKASSRIDMLY